MVQRNLRLQHPHEWECSTFKNNQRPNFYLDQLKPHVASFSLTGHPIKHCTTVPHCGIFKNSILDWNSWNSWIQLVNQSAVQSKQSDLNWQWVWPNFQMWLSLPFFLVLLVKQVIQGLDIFKFTIVSRAKNGTDTYGVLITQLHCLCRIHDVVVFTQFNILQLHFKVSCKLLPTHLYPTLTLNPISTHRNTTWLGENSGECYLGVITCLDLTTVGEKMMVATQGMENLLHGRSLRMKLGQEKRAKPAHWHQWPSWVYHRATLQPCAHFATCVWMPSQQAW